MPPLSKFPGAPGVAAESPAPLLIVVSVPSRTKMAGRPQRRRHRRHCRCRRKRWRKARRRCHQNRRRRRRRRHRRSHQAAATTAATAEAAIAAVIVVPAATAAAEAAIATGAPDHAAIKDGAGSAGFVAVQGRPGTPAVPGSSPAPPPPPPAPPAPPFKPTPRRARRDHAAAATAGTTAAVPGGGAAREKQPSAATGSIEVVKFASASGTAGRLAILEEHVPDGDDGRRLVHENPAARAEPATAAIVAIAAIAALGGGVLDAQIRDRDRAGIDEETGKGAGPVDDDGAVAAPSIVRSLAIAGNAPASVIVQGEPQAKSISFEPPAEFASRDRLPQGAGPGIGIRGDHIHRRLRHRRHGNCQSETARPKQNGTRYERHGKDSGRPDGDRASATIITPWRQVTVRLRV